MTDETLATVKKAHRAAQKDFIDSMTRICPMAYNERRARRLRAERLRDLGKHTS